MVKTKEFMDKVKEIKSLFERADEVFSTFTDVENHETLQFHNEFYSLNHCVRWGLQAVTELDEADNSDD